MKRQFLFLSFFALVFTACSEDFFESTASIKVPEQAPRLAVTAHLAAGDTTLRVFVSHSLGILSNSQPDIIANANVELSKDGQLLATIPFVEGLLYEQALPNPLPADLSEYRLMVSAPGYDATEALQTMPAIVPILSASYEVDGAINSDGEKVDELTVEFQDPPGEDNYYAIRVWVLYDDNGYKDEWYLDNLDVLAEDLGDDLVIKDDSFDGKKYKWRFSTYHFAEPGTAKMLVQLRSISKDKYLFLKSAWLSEENNDNPFAEPVIIHNNIVGGYGIFSLEAKSEMQIDL
ncbi:MAG: DUF4249 domain-containing protein [Saprospiraceae bacterium]|nr:MAG: DUF4249 domain-containing protein [Saprospiraceae bacterium]